ncbi:hypothetical protein EXT60_22335 [Pectobacterium carotovorum subsp. carotovorum]|nr:hypothetical protein [Pectobacterium carotovorum subsp. carotovorum]
MLAALFLPLITTAKDTTAAGLGLLLLTSSTAPASSQATEDTASALFTSEPSGEATSGSSYVTDGAAYRGEEMGYLLGTQDTAKVDVGLDEGLQLLLRLLPLKDGYTGVVDGSFEVIDDAREVSFTSSERIGHNC